MKNTAMRSTDESNKKNQTNRSLKDIRLLASDMDGTLLNDNREITLRTQDAIRKWVASGRFFVPTTGRPLCAMGKVDPLFDKDMLYIVYNGAMAVMHRSKEVLFSVTLAPALVPEVYQLGNERDVPIIIWCRDELYVNKDCEESRLYMEATSAPFTVVKDNIELEKLAAAGVTKMLWIDSPEQVLVHQRDMQAHFGDKINCHASRPELFEFVGNDASKAIALETVIPKLGVSREEIAAVGDGYNDLSMLRYAGYSIAMGNAPADIQAECDHVTLANNEDGVAVWMEEIMSL